MKKERKIGVMKESTDRQRRKASIWVQRKREEKESNEGKVSEDDRRKYSQTREKSINLSSTERR